jgi:hypothetical protein
MALGGPDKARMFPQADTAPDGPWALTPPARGGCKIWRSGWTPHLFASGFFVPSPFFFERWRTNLSKSDCAA